MIENENSKNIINYFNCYLNNFLTNIFIEEGEINYEIYRV